MAPSQPCLPEAAARSGPPIADLLPNYASQNAGNTQTVVPEKQRYLPQNSSECESILPSLISPQAKEARDPQQRRSSFLEETEKAGLALRRVSQHPVNVLPSSESSVTVNCCEPPMGSGKPSEPATDAKFMGRPSLKRPMHMEPTVLKDNCANPKKPIHAVPPDPQVHVSTVVEPAYDEDTR